MGYIRVGFENQLEHLESEKLQFRYSILALISMHTIYPAMLVRSTSSNMVAATSTIAPAVASMYVSQQQGTTIYIE